MTGSAPRMEPVLNPLYDTAQSVLKSPQRMVPRPSQQQQHKGAKQQNSPPQKAPGRFKQLRKSCIHSTPWLVVLAITVLVAAQIVWAVHTDRFVAAALQLLDKGQMTVPPQLASAMFIMKAVLIGVTSFLGAMVLILGVIVKRQRMVKQTATTRADWPHGCKSHCTMALCIGLAMLLWLAAATFVGLLCFTFTATGVALAGDVAAGQALSFAEANPFSTQQLQATLKQARTAFVGAVQNAPPVVKRMDWFEKLTSSMQPLVGQQGSSNSTSQADGTCPSTCLNLRLITHIIDTSAESPTAGCLCLRSALQQAQQLLKGMWKDGLTAFIALSVLASLATWLLIYCLVACMVTFRDNSEAKYCKHLLQQEDQRDGNINHWMWTAGIASPNSNSGTTSSFPALEAPLDAKRPPQLLAPELTSSTLSPSPRKQGKRQQQHDQDMQQARAGDVQADDIERPAQVQPDQLPLQPMSAAPDSPHQRVDQLQLPTVTPVNAGLLPTGRAAPRSSTGRRDAPSGNSGTSTSSHRRRWQEVQHNRR